MRYLMAMVCLAAIAGAQEKSKRIESYTFDFEGRRVSAGSQEAAGGAAGEYHTTPDGRRVPRETVEETVLQEDASGRRVERVTRRYDAAGRLSSTVKTLIEEEKREDGSASVRTSVFESTVNGRLELSERSVAELERSGQGVRELATIERPGVNGRLEPVERRERVSRKQDSTERSETVVIQRDANGAFRPVGREVKVERQEGGITSRQVDFYSAAVSGKLELSVRTESKIERSADGREIEVTDVYGAAGYAQAADGYTKGLKLRERQLVDRRPQPSGGLVETISVQRTAVDSSRLGPPRKIAENVCSGACLP